MTLWHTLLLLFLFVSSAISAEEGDAGDGGDEGEDNSNELEFVVRDSELCHHMIEVVPGLMDNTRWLVLNNHWILVSSGHGQTVKENTTGNADSGESE